jgi:hypothetical protein
VWSSPNSSMIEPRSTHFDAAATAARSCALSLTVACALFMGQSAAQPQAHALSPIEASPSGDEAEKAVPGNYRQIAPGLLGRTLFSTSQAGPAAVQIMDILVGPGKAATIPNIDFAALIEVEAGDATVALDGNAAAARQEGVIAVGQGQTIAIDNSGDSRSFVARLIRLSLPAQ